MESYQTYLQDCDFEHTGIIIKNGLPICRWCRKPYAKGGNMSYEKEHFEQPKPLFTTEDNVPIYTWHEVVWFVYASWYYGSKQAASYNVEELSHTKWFSTEEKAKDYILMNKLCLSVNDIHSKLKEWYGKQMAEVKEAVIELAKQKIKQ